MTWLVELQQDNGVGSNTDSLLGREEEMVRFPLDRANKKLDF